jgi:hypothetical protein
MQKVVLVVLFFFGIVANSEAVDFTLRNNSLRSIYLEIPGVMNPNLSLFSSSGVNLAKGQKLFFFYENERYELLTVTASLEGQRINVSRLIRLRKKELAKSE